MTEPQIEKHHAYKKKHVVDGLRFSPSVKIFCLRQAPSGNFRLRRAENFPPAAGSF